MALKGRTVPYGVNAGNIFESLYISCIYIILSIELCLYLYVYYFQSKWLLK